MRTYNKLVGVIAGNAREFEFYSNEICLGATSYTRTHHATIVDDTKYIYVHEPDNMRGVQFADIIVYGNYFLKKDLHVYRAIAEANLRRKVAW